MPISENAKAVLERRYLARNEAASRLKRWTGLFHRSPMRSPRRRRLRSQGRCGRPPPVRFTGMMTELDFLPNSPTLMNAGRPLGQLSACFVLPVADSMEDIFDAIKNAALIHKSGGGTGFLLFPAAAQGLHGEFHRRRGQRPVSFMKVFNAATEAVKQGGTRRGANMGILRVDHPDIMDFITCKNNTSEITNFNISVGITESFMEAVGRDGMYDLVDPATAPPPAS